MPEGKEKNKKGKGPLFLCSVEKAGCGFLKPLRPEKGDAGFREEEKLNLSLRNRGWRGGGLISC